MSLDTEMLEVKQYFNTNHIKLSDCWLENCTEWFRENNSSYTQKQMLMKIYEQWLLLDLRQVEICILPEDINATKKMVLEGIYSLQLMQVLDLSKPKLYQIQQIRNSKMLEHIKETDYTVNTKRILQLTLTDGVQEVKVIEYNIIKSLHKDLTPGMKIQIKGPVTVRRGQILLEKEESVKLLGGEVEELLVSNAYENVLARDLELPINPSPVPLNEPVPDANVSTKAKKLSTQIKVGRNLDNPEEAKRMPYAKDEYLAFDKKAEFLKVDDEYSTKRRKISKSPDLFGDEDLDDEIFKNIDLPGDIQSEQLPSSAENDKKETTGWDNSFDDIIDDKLFEDIKTIDLPITDYIDIKVLKDNIDKRKYGKYKIKAKFKTILEKLTVNDYIWYMKLSVEDETDYIECLMHNDIITELIGYSASKMMEFKANVINKDKEIIDAIYKAIEEFRNKVLDINCIMEITYNETIKAPIITKLFGK